VALLTQYNHSDKVLHWTLLLSIFVHAVGIYLIPKIDYTPEQEPKILTVELAPPPQPKAAPEPPQPVQQQPIKPQPVKPLPQKIPTPVAEKSPEPQRVAEPPPNIITAPAKPENPAPVVAPAPPAPPEPVRAPPPPPPQVDYDGLSQQYARLISREVAKNKQYPKVAQMRGWQGEAIIQILVDANGKVLESRIHTSSGFDILDKQAIKMVNEANLPLPPEALRNKPISVLIPISFKLE
jgi:periplasmic protein TonB